MTIKSAEAGEPNGRYGRVEEEPFIDFYEILQISPQAEQETIERVYRLLAKRFHPDVNGSGESGKFDLITKAYRLLSDPEKRKEYDTNYGRGGDFDWKSSWQKAPSNGAGSDQEVYQEILAILYTARRKDAQNPGVGIVQLEKILGCPEKHLEFHIWYLKEKGWIQRLENGAFAITVEGVDAVIEKDLLAKKGRLLPPAQKFSADSGNPEK
jgi:curved DNA-binding protein